MRTTGLPTPGLLRATMLGAAGGASALPPPDLRDDSRWQQGAPV